MHYANGRAAKAGDIVRGKAVEATIEYGQLDAFVAIDPETGEVLPPEPAPVPTRRIPAAEAQI